RGRRDPARCGGLPAGNGAGQGERAGRAGGQADRGGRTAPRDLPRDAAPLRLVRRERGSGRPLAARRDGDPTRGERLQGPAHRLVAGAVGARLAPHGGHRRGDAVLLRALLRTPARIARRCPRHRGLRRALRLRGGASTLVRRAVPSGEVERGGAPAARQLHLDLSLFLYPAIDIRGGKAVRLIQGDYGREKSYDDDPVVAARRWADAGAAWLHVVDLDGARAGEPVNLAHVRRIVEAV